MNATTNPSAPDVPRRRYLPAMLLLFVGSGCAALIYEIVWFQLLQFVVGASGISLGVLLGTFMGGMFLGSLALPRFVSADRHPLRVYAVIELGIAVMGLALLFVIPAVGEAYQAVAPGGASDVFVRAILCGAMLIPPTVLMGATLPAIARYVKTTPEGVAWMGFFYAGNIAGAVVGALLAGYYLLRVTDIPTATAVAAAINVAVAGLAFLLARVAEHRPGETSEAEAAPTIAPVFPKRHRAVFVAIAISGFTALGAEVVWTRLLSLLLGATTYTFSLILAVFLAALGVGSAAGSYMARSVADPRRALGLCQAAVAAGIAWTAYMLSSALPFWPVNPSLTADPWYLFQIDVARTVIAILPAPLLWGASFPLAVAAAADPDQDPGRLMGGVYAANTLGAIVGALGFGLVGIPLLGTQGAQRVLALGGAVAAVLLLLPSHEPAAGAEARRGGRPAWAVAAFVVALILATRIPAVPPVLVAYGRYAPTYDPPNALFVGEGRNSSVAVTELDNGDRNIHIGGKVVASTEPQDMALQRMLGHMTALLHEEPKSVLIVGFGAGVTAGAFVTHPSIERIVVAEIEPLVTKVASRYFEEPNHHVLDDPRVEVVLDDARHYLLTTDETFDLITADPIHPWMKGAAALYSREYFELAKEHLNPGGVITQWVPLYETSAEVVKSEFATFFEVFPEGTVWANRYNGAGYDVVLAATDGPPVIDLDRWASRLATPGHAPVASSLADVGIYSTNDLLATYAGGARSLAPWLADATINRDRNLSLMYMAGLALNRYEQDDILNRILRYREFPRDVFVGNPGRVERLRISMGG